MRVGCHVLRKLYIFCVCVYNIYVYVLFFFSSGDELETIISGVRNEVKAAGQQDTRENCWSFFIDRVRKQLKASVSVLC